MPRLSRTRTRAVRVALGAIGLFGMGALGWEYVGGHPYYWSPVEAEIRMNGLSTEGGVFRHEGLYLLDFDSRRSGGPRSTTSPARTVLSVEPAAGIVSEGNGATRWILGRRTVLLHGVVMSGDAKTEREATAVRTSEGLRVTIAPGLSGRGTPPDTIEVRLPSEPSLVESHRERRSSEARG